MFGLFSRKPERPANFRGIYIDGNLYSRHGTDIYMTTRSSDEACLLEAGHVAPNGVAIGQIAYAIALIEGMIAVNPSFNQASSGIGLN